MAQISASLRAFWAWYDALNNTAQFAVGSGVGLIVGGLLGLLVGLAI